MRAGFLLVLLGLLINAGCGYVGPIVPPSPMQPLAVNDLTVTERGDKLYLAFSTPAATTDALGIKRLSDIELRMGPGSEPFDFTRWAESSRQYEVAPPSEDDEDEPKPVPIRKAIPVSEWQGKTITVAVRTAVKGERHFSQWSNRVSLDVVAPLQPPVIAVEATSQGYRLTWQPERPSLHYQIMRSSPTDKVPVAIGVAERPEYIDSTSQFDTPYVYTVIAQEGPSVESLPSAPFPIDKPDKFAPSVPADITVLAGPDSVEITWTRSPEPDLKGYLVYRSVNNGPFTVTGELTALPTFSDHKVEHGHTYRYAISAVDQKNNESDKSKPAEVAF